MAHQLLHPRHNHPHVGPTRRDFLSTLLSAAVLAPWALGQRKSQTPAEMAEGFRQLSEKYEQEGLAKPFRGITTNNEVMPGLYEIRPSGVSSEPVRNAA